MHFTTVSLIRQDMLLMTSHSFKYIKNELLPINCSKLNSICMYTMKIIIDKDTTNGNIILIYVLCSTNNSATDKANAHIPTPLTLFPNKSLYFPKKKPIGKDKPYAHAIVPRCHIKYL